MGQDSEEAAEFVVTVRNEHVKMKDWYTNSQDEAIRALQEKFGPYPSLWKEVLNWPGWKETRKEYLKAMQLREERPKNGDTAVVKIEEGAAPLPRKRKSRWGTAGSNANSDQGVDPASNNKRFAPMPPQQQQLQPPPLQRGAPRVVLPSISSVTTNLTEQQQQDLKNMQAKLRVVNERLANLDEEAERVDALPRGHRDRSPSPPPIYGPDGKRKNTRAVRWRERYTAERQDLLEGIMRLSSKGAGGPAAGLPTGATSLLIRRRVKKIRIPVEEHPNYNFIGLIIGPRGKTQKELEAKTGCKIAIRGRGSVKEGARGRRDGKVMEGDNEPLHVVISGDDQRAVDAASDMVEQMLVVIDDEKNVHKQQQLRELALLNGTLKEEDVFCQICAEKGHRSFECPKRFASKGGVMGVTVKCAICGDTSHPTRDCTRKVDIANMAGGDGGSNQQQMDSEYLSFMAELDGKKAEASKPPGERLSTSQSVSDKLPPPPPNVDLPPPPQMTALPPLPANGPLKPPSVAPPVNLDLTSSQHQQHRQPNQNPLYGHFHQSQQQDGTLGHQHFQQQAGGLGPGHYNNQYPHGSYGHQQPQQQQGYGQQPQQQQPVPAQVQPGEETAGWDPSSYYGNYDNNAAGGFNWWEQ
ncbi:hypothetical protein ACA910_002435 [Epithemia clementina (nom. ined.)]